MLDFNTSLFTIPIRPILLKCNIHLTLTYNKSNLIIQELSAFVRDPHNIWPIPKPAATRLRSPTRIKKINVETHP